MSVDAVLSRIAEIRTQIDALRGTPTTAAASGSTASGAASSGAFADALATATGTGTAATTTSAGAASTAGATAAPATSVDAGRGTLATGSGATGSDVVAAAEKYLGVPYVFGGESRSGMDCSGLVQTVFKDLGVTMPRVVPDQADMGVPVGSLQDAKPGDLIIPKGEQHIVIYVGEGKVLHAPRPGKDVRIVDNWYKDSDIATIRRIVPSEATAPAATPTVASAASAQSVTDLQTAALLSAMRVGSAA
ncbi:NlpC/P60 family protein [Curtobacterium sp. MCSS17_008]|uniref:C40 family peptidase n=1 Tax=Curtobacterium sp. MCSS17_008 TaxID=2175647 RepID=UPI000DA864A3|nr:C40 family peptidase [Curtobacterium sp. MCSS17_008]PZF59633.1 NlpC/P60 family protein [Curtobacterium sp. MCSS17_008]